MRRLRLLALVLLCLARPSGAYAQDVLDWLANFSGPGPFYGHFGQSVNVRALCIREDGGGHKADACLLDDSDEKIKVVVGVTFSWVSSHNNPRFSGAASNDPLNALPVNVSRIEGTYSYRVGPMLDVGVGVGALVFSGDGFTNQAHPIFTPVQFTFLPLGFMKAKPGQLHWGRLLRLRFADRYVLGDINARADFGSTSSYLTHGEFNPSYSIGLDVLSLFPRAR